MSGSRVVFYSRNKPLGQDVIDICLEYRRTFVGYPAWRCGPDDKPWDNVADQDFVERVMIDLRRGRVADGALHPGCQARGYRAQVTRNANLFREIEPGAITLIPRPERGVVYAGFVVDRLFSANVRPDLLSAVFGEPTTCSHVANVTQGWSVDCWRPLPFASYPAWIRKSFFGRSTVSRVHPVDGMDPHEEITHLTTSQDENKISTMHVYEKWTTCQKDVLSRLKRDIGPHDFEHLVVALLQLEHEEQTWRHVGGVGDGGVDGMGVDRLGRVELLQCKWNGWHGDLLEPNGATFVAASLHGRSYDHAVAGVRVWDGERIAELTIKHSARLPWARSMRIGQAR